MLRVFLIPLCLVSAACTGSMLWTPSQRLENPSRQPAPAANSKPRKTGPVTPVVCAAAPDARLQPEVYRVLRKVPRFRDFVKRSPHPAYLLEEDNKAYWKVVIGENFPDHFVRWETVRIWKSGRVDRLRIADYKWEVLLN